MKEITIKLTDKEYYQFVKIGNGIGQSTLFV